MQLTLWTYEGPPHVGAMRVATGMKDVHYVLHGPQGDTYADLLFTMIERRDHRPPVTWTTFQAQDLGGDTATLFQDAVRNAYERFQPNAMLVGATCTAELIQDDPAGLSDAMGLPVPVVPLELPAYQRKENWGASETFYQLVRHLAGPHAPEPGTRRPSVAERAAAEDRRPRCNLLGPSALGFRHRDDVTEITRLLDRIGVDVSTTAPMGATTGEIAGLGLADFNVLLYPEVGGQAASYLKRTFGQPSTQVVPIGIGATRDFVEEVAGICELEVDDELADLDSRLPWYSRSVDSTYFTGKRVFVFGDATHAVAMARVAAEELGFEVVGLGCYNREFARDVRAAAKKYGLEPLITDDYLEVEAAVKELAPEMVLGTQMERHIAKRLNTFCAVISAPVHVQDFPARYSPVMGPEGANVLFDTLVHPLVMGLEEHLLGMFQDDFEFGNDQGPSHRAGAGFQARDMEGAVGAEAPAAEHPSHRNGDSAHEPAAAAALEPVPSGDPVWTPDAQAELKKIPFFVRKKAKRNTESFAADQGIHPISVETLYEAKAHFGGGR